MSLFDQLQVIAMPFAVAYWVYLTAVNLIPELEDDEGESE